jgi:hypothetical protein
MVQELLLLHQDLVVVLFIDAPLLELDRACTLARLVGGGRPACLISARLQPAPSTNWHFSDLPWFLHAKWFFDPCLKGLVMWLFLVIGDEKLSGPLLGLIMMSYWLGKV